MLVILLDTYIVTISATSGLIWPLLRFICRFLKKIKPYHKRCVFIQDVTNGAALPYFCLMILSIFEPSVAIESYIIFLAGVYGSHAIVSDIVKE